MKTVLFAVLAALSLTGCVAYPTDGYVTTEVVYEPDVVVNGYYVGYYEPRYGYWTGTDWDVNFYVYGHGGYGHYYRGAPRGYYHNYYHGPHYVRGYTRHNGISVHGYYRHH